MQSKGDLEMCDSHYMTLVRKKKQPLDVLAYFLHYAHDELPSAVKSAISRASIFNQMLITWAWVTSITQLYVKNKKSPLYGTNLSESQQYSQGNVAILDQDSLHLQRKLPPDHDEIKKSACAVFMGSGNEPDCENIKRLKPKLVNKGIVCTLIDFLLTKNSWYCATYVEFNPVNLSALYDNEHESNHGNAIPATVDLCCIPVNNDAWDEEVKSDFNQVMTSGIELKNNNEDTITMGSIGYTDGDFTMKNYRQMKVTALAWCLDGNREEQGQG